MRYVVGFAVMAAVAAVGYQIGRVSALRKARMQAAELHRIVVGLTATIEDARREVQRRARCADGVLADGPLPINKSDVAGALARGELAVYYPREGTS